MTDVPLRYISLLAAESLTGKSRRTLWRWLGDGALARGPDDAQGRCMVRLDQLLAHACLHVSAALQDVLCAADAGDLPAQCEWALVLLEAGQDGAAVQWLEQAAKHGHADAMQWLARCKVGGLGCRPDEHQAMVWLARAASAGHAIARAQMAQLI